MESDSIGTKEEHEAREKFRTTLVREGKKITEQREGRGPDLSAIPPHLMHRR